MKIWNLNWSRSLVATEMPRESWPFQSECLLLYDLSQYSQFCFHCGLTGWWVADSRARGPCRDRTRSSFGPQSVLLPPKCTCYIQATTKPVRPLAQRNDEKYQILAVKQFCHRNRIMVNKMSGCLFGFCCRQLDPKMSDSMSFPSFARSTE